MSQPPPTQAEPPADAPVPPEALAALELLRHRRSIAPATFRPDPVPAAWLDAILEAGSWAPTHGMNEPWRFVVFTGPSIRALGRARIASYEETTPEPERKPGKLEKIARVHEVVPAAIALGAAVGANPKIPGHEDRAAVACAAQNMMLAATALGLGSFWSTGALAYSPSMREFLGFRAPVEPMGFIFLGFPSAPWPEGRRQPLEGKVTRRG